MDEDYEVKFNNAVKNAIIALNNPEIVEKIENVVREKTGHAVSIAFTKIANRQNKIHFILHTPNRIDIKDDTALELAVYKLLDIDSSEYDEAIIFDEARLYEESTIGMDDRYASIIPFSKAEFPKVSAFLRENYPSYFKDTAAEETHDSKRQRGSSKEFWRSDNSPTVTPTTHLDPEVLLAYLQENESIWNALRQSPEAWDEASNRVKRALGESHHISPSKG